MTRPRSRTIGALVGLALLAGACGGGDSTNGDAEAGSSASTSTTAAPGAGTTEESTTSTAAPADDAAGVIEIEIAGGDIVGGLRRETVELGSEVTLRATSDAVDELHVHTYDLTVDLVTAGAPAELTFIADIPGIHEIELHRGHKRVLELEVSP